MADSPTGGNAPAGGNAPTGGNASTMEGDLANLRRDVTRLTDTVSRLVTDGASSARAAAREGAESARATVVSAADDLSETVVRNPLTSVLAALGVGYLMGVLGRSRH